MSLLDTFPLGAPHVLIRFLTAQNPAAPFVNNQEISLVFAENIVSYFQRPTTDAHSVTRKAFSNHALPGASPPSA